jgi:5'-methylthioadenosine phosphorylase
MAQQARVGIIGGSGLYQMPGISGVESVTLDTPFGAPSDAYRIGTLTGTRVAFLARHGQGHRLLPSEINFRANIYGFKALGVERIISVSAVGSLKDEIAALDVVVPDQFIDRTRGRVSTFFGGGLVAHVSFADPVCGDLSRVLGEAAVAAGARVHHGGTYLCMEGPAFSTRAESHLYRSWGASVIGMTNLQEAKLAREAEICYATLAMATDYDCWHHEEEAVTVEAVIARLKQNAEMAGKTIRDALARLPAERACPCATALKNTLLTDPAAVPEEARRRLALLVGRYLPGSGG